MIRRRPALVTGFVAVVFAGLGARSVDPAPPLVFSVALGAVGMLLLAGGLAADGVPGILARVRGSSAALAVLAAALAVLVGEALVVGTAERLTPLLYAFNVVALAGLALVAIGATGRTAAGLAIALYLFFVLEVANALKLRWLLVPVLPGDLRRLADLLDVASSRDVVVVAAAAGGVAIVGGVLVRRSSHRPRRRGACALAGLAALGLAWLAGGRLVGQARVPLREAAMEGHLAYFLWHTRDAFVAKPAGYGRAAIDDVLARRGSSAPDAAGADEPPTVILYLIESFTDPAWLGLRFTEEPAPRFRALYDRSPGLVALAPGFGGDSANSEFELLTGLPVALLPPNRVPYVQDVWRPLPSIVREFRAHGYATRAVHAGYLRFYNIDRVYPLLGFDDLMTVKDGGAPRAASGRYGSDEAVVDEILRIVDRGAPAFVFAFPASTHWPYDYDAYLDSPLDVIAPGLHPAVHRQVKTYINAVRAADRALGRLVDRLGAVPRPVLLLVLGDHWPPLSNDAYASLRDGAEDTFGTRAAEHRVPLLVWSNRPVTLPPSGLAFSALAPQIVAMAGLRASRYWAALRDLSGALPAARDDWRAGEPGEHERSAARDLALLEYDVLFGDAHSQAGAAAEPR